MDYFLNFFATLPSIVTHDQLSVIYCHTSVYGTAVRLGLEQLFHDVREEKKLKTKRHLITCGPSVWHTHLTLTLHSFPFFRYQGVGELCFHITTSSYQRRIKQMPSEEEECKVNEIADFHIKNYKIFNRFFLHLSLTPTRSSTYFISRVIVTSPK